MNLGTRIKVKKNSKLYSILFLVLIIPSLFLFQNQIIASYIDTSSSIRLSALVALAPHPQDLTIPSGSIVYIDRSVTVERLTINGELHCDSRGENNITITAKQIIVNNLLQCGTPENPYGNEQERDDNGNLLFDEFGGPVHKKITFSLRHTDGFNTDTPEDILKYKLNENYRALIVARGGKLVLTGNGRGSSWHKLHETVVGARRAHSFKIAGDVSQSWSPGDSIAIAPTGYDPSYLQRHLYGSRSAALVSEQLRKWFFAV
jgi:hypothetical protein